MANLDKFIRSPATMFDHLFDFDAGTYEYRESAFNSVEDLVVYGILNFGYYAHTEEILKYAYDGLKYIKLLTEKISEFGNDINGWRQDHESHIFGSYGQTMFFYYWASDRYLIDYGVSICYPWLSPLGKNVLDYLSIKFKG